MKQLETVGKLRKWERVIWWQVAANKEPKNIHSRNDTTLDKRNANMSVRHVWTKMHLFPGRAFYEENVALVRESWTRSIGKTTERTQMWADKTSRPKNICSSGTSCLLSTWTNGEIQQGHAPRLPWACPTTKTFNNILMFFYHKWGACVVESVVCFDYNTWWHKCWKQFKETFQKSIIQVICLRDAHGFWSVDLRTFPHLELVSSWPSICLR